MDEMSERTWLQRALYPLAYIFGWPMLALASTGIGAMLMGPVLFPPYTVMAWWILVAAAPHVLPVLLLPIYYLVLIGGLVAVIFGAKEGQLLGFRTDMLFGLSTLLFLLLVVYVVHFDPTPLAPNTF